MDRGLTDWFVLHHLAGGYDNRAGKCWLALADGLLSYLPSVFWLLGSGTERGEFRSDKVQNGAFMFLRRERVRRRLSVFYVTTEKTAQSLWLVCTRGFCPPALI